MKRLHFILICFIVLLAPDVFAKDVDVTNKCYGTTGYASMYSGDEVQYQTYSNYNFGTTYEYQLSSFETELRYSLTANTDYIITFNTNNTNDFRNNFKTYNVYDLNHNSNNLVTGFTYVSMKKVQISFKTTSATNKVKIQMGGSNVYDNITGDSNWNIKNAILTIPDTAPSGSTNQDVIDNATNNTNNIINNNNQNTSDIINNNNNNTQTIIDSQQNIDNSLNSNCKNGPNTYNAEFAQRAGIYLNSDGSFTNNSTWVITKFFRINSNTQYTFKFSGTGNSPSMCFYRSKDFSSSSLINCRAYSGENTFTITTPSAANYMVLSLGTLRYVEITGPICNNWEQEAQESTTNAINETNEYLKDNSDPSISDNDFLSMFNNVGVNDPLSYLLTLPTRLINKIVSSSNTCSSINLGSLYGVLITLPCINLENTLGSSVWNIIDVIFSVSLLVVILKNLYDTFSNLLTMGAEKEAKEKFSMPTPMDFLSMILGGDR